MFIYSDGYRLDGNIKRFAIQGNVKKDDFESISSSDCGIDPFLNKNDDHNNNGEMKANVESESSDSTSIVGVFARNAYTLICVGIDDDSVFATIHMHCFTQLLFCNEVNKMRMDVMNKDGILH